MRAVKHSSFILLLPGGGDSVRCGSESVEGVFSDGGGDSGAVGHLPGAPRSVLRAGGRSRRLAPRRHAVLCEGPQQRSGGRPVLPGPAPQVRARQGGGKWQVSARWSCRCDCCPLSCAGRGSTATPPVSACSPAVCCPTAHARCRWPPWWPTSASRQPTPRRCCSTTRWRRTSTSSATSCTNCVLRSADNQRRVELLTAAASPFKPMIFKFAEMSELIQVSSVYLKRCLNKHMLTVELVGLNIIEYSILMKEYKTLVRCYICDLFSIFSFVHFNRRPVSFIIDSSACYCHDRSFSL